MSRLEKLLKASAIVVGTSLAAYGGNELGQYVAEDLPTGISQFVQGFSAFFLGNVGYQTLRGILRREEVPPSEAYSIAALAAFAKAPNEKRIQDPAKSLKQVTQNIVQIIHNTGAGTGLRITSDGYVITAYHVVSDPHKNKEPIAVKNPQGKHLGNVVEMWVREDKDVAILKTDQWVQRPKPLGITIDCTYTPDEKNDDIILLTCKDGVTKEYGGRFIQWLPSEARGRSGSYVEFITTTGGDPGVSGSPFLKYDGALFGIASAGVGQETSGVSGGILIYHALELINDIIAEKSAKMF